MIVHKDRIMRAVGTARYERGRRIAWAHAARSGDLSADAIELAQRVAFMITVATILPILQADRRSSLAGG